MKLHVQIIIFLALPNDTLIDLLNQPSMSREVISFHMIPGRLLTTTIIDGQKFSPLISNLQLRMKLQKKVSNIYFFP